MFLTREEVETLTGFKRKVKQCEQLRRQGVAFRTNIRGEPIVCRSVIEGTIEKKQKADNDAWEPALSA